MQMVITIVLAHQNTRNFAYLEIGWSRRPPKGCWGRLGNSGGSRLGLTRGGRGQAPSTGDLAVTLRCFCCGGCHVDCLAVAIKPLQHSTFISKALSMQYCQGASNITRRNDGSSLPGETMAISIARKNSNCTLLLECDHAANRARANRARADLTNHQTNLTSEHD